MELYFERQMLIDIALMLAYSFLAPLALAFFFLVVDKMVNRYQINRKRALRVKQIRIDNARRIRNEIKTIL